MNIEDYVGVCQKERQGKSFAFLAERCATSAEAPYRIKPAGTVLPEETCVLVLAGAGGFLRGYNGVLKKRIILLKVFRN